MAGVDSSSTKNNNQSLIDQINAANSSTKTKRGTRIVKPGQDMDKNAFLRILSAELSNQDPQNAKDGTEYVAQMAQFAGLEQMANLNSSMRLTGANSLIGRQVMLNKYDEKGQLYSGQVINAVKNGDEINLSVIVGVTKDKDGNPSYDIKKFSMQDVSVVEDLNSMPDSSYDSMNLLNASSLIGKNVEINQKDSSNNNYTGIVKGVSRGADGIKINVQIGQELKEFPFYQVIKVKES